MVTYFVVFHDLSLWEHSDVEQRRLASVQHM